MAKRFIVSCRHPLFSYFLLGGLLANFMAGASRAEEIPVAANDDLPRVLKSPRPGDQFVLQEGVWQDVDLVFEGQGTADKPIMLKAAVPGKTVFTGQSRLRLSGTHLIIQGLSFQDITGNNDVIEFRTHSRRLAENCRVTDCEIISSLEDRTARENRWISIYGQQNRVDHCRFQGKANSGTTLVVWVGETPGHHRIDHNLFGPRPELGKNGGETIRIGTSDVSQLEAGCLVEENWFEECDGEAECISNKSCGNTYRRNVFVKCAGTLTLRHGNRCLVEGNIFLGAGKKKTGGIRLIGEDHRVINNYLEALTGDDERSALCFMNGVPQGKLNEYAQVRRALVACNSIIDCKAPLTIGLKGSSRATLPPADCTIALNLWSCGQRQLAIRETEEINWRWTGNVANQNSPYADSGIPGLQAGKLDFWRSPDGLLRPDDDSPLLMQPGSEDFGVELDLDGQRRIVPAQAGCDVSSNVPVTWTIPLRRDRGPTWNRTSEDSTPR